MINLKRALNPYVTSFGFLVISGIFTPSLLSAYSLVSALPENANVVDSGEIACYASAPSVSVTNIFCRNSFSSTKAILTKIELLAPSASRVKITVNSFPFVDEVLLASQTKTFALTSTINPSTSNYAAASIYTSSNVQLLKAFFSINGVEKNVSFSSNYNASEYTQVEKLDLYLIDGVYVPPPTQEEIADSCMQKHGIRSIVYGSSCSCPIGYTFDIKDQCSPLSAVCIERSGSHSVPVGDNQCGCAYGYHIESTYQQCVENEKPAPVVSPVSIVSLPVQVASVPSVTSPSRPVDIPQSLKNVVAEKRNSTGEKIMLATSTEINIISTTTKEIPSVVEEVKIETPPVTVSPPAKKTFWSRIINWFKFW